MAADLRDIQTGNAMGTWEWEVEAAKEQFRGIGAIAYPLVVGNMPMH